MEMVTLQGIRGTVFLLPHVMTQGSSGENCMFCLSFPISCTLFVMFTRLPPYLAEGFGGMLN